MSCPPCICNVYDGFEVFSRHRYSIQGPSSQTSLGYALCITHLIQYHACLLVLVLSFLQKKMQQKKIHGYPHYCKTYLRAAQLQNLLTKVGAAPPRAEEAIGEKSRRQNKKQCRKNNKPRNSERQSGIQYKVGQLP